VFEERVLSHVLAIPDPVERLRRCMRLNIDLVTRGWSKEVTIILHEHATLHGESREYIDGRKKRYVRFLEESFGEAVKLGRIRPVPCAAHGRGLRVPRDGAVDLQVVPA
jgi:TetR/AcrR family transcriptional regulator, cholesterol catabolism regulator